MFATGWTVRESNPDGGEVLGWTVRGSNPDWERFSAPFQTGPEDHPAFHKMGTRSFLGVKRPGRGFDHPLLSSAEVKERVELCLYSPSGPSWPVLGELYLYLYGGVCTQRFIVVDAQVRSAKQEALQNCAVYRSRSLQHKCDLLSTGDKIRSVILQHNTKLCGRCKKTSFTFERHFQMDIDVFQRDFADKDGYVSGYKLTIEDVRT